MRGRLLLLAFLGAWLGRAAQSMTCEEENGVCVREKTGSDCHMLSGDCDKGEICCRRQLRQIPPSNSTCSTSTACSSQGGTCIPRTSPCPKQTQEGLCKSEECVCCLPKLAKQSACQCGASVANRIIGGTEVDPPYKYPWLASLVLSRNPTSLLCGGSLLNDRYVVTAAHCMYNARGKLQRASKFMVRLADHNLQTTDDDVAATRLLGVESYVVHDGFSLRRLNKDIALLRLDAAVDIASFSELKPVCLPPDDSNTYKKMDAFVAGWGDTSNGFGLYPDAPREVRLRVSRCPRTIASIKRTKFMLCAGRKKGGKDACYGDSGGPLMVQEDDGRFVLVGIVSFGDECALPGVPGVYTKVSKLLDWIAENTADATYCQ